MNIKLSVMAILACVLPAACASQHDNFYTLSVLPDGASNVAAVPAVHVMLSVDIPAIVDRAEIVISRSQSDVQVLDHERWVSSLSDQVLQTLARDIESRRNDVLVGDRSFGVKALSSVIMHVDIVKMSARSGSGVSVAAHWRIQNETASTDDVGTGVFDAQTEDGSYASVAKAYSRALGALADKLAAGIGAAGVGAAGVGAAGPGAGSARPAG